ncbi:MAG: hypothetical protein ACXWQJ_19185, partial [Bdellovibrionota bacterium]
LALLQRQRETRPESMKSIFILVTKNSSQSAVAQAAEEDIDSFIMKPYTPETLCKAIVRAVVAKEYPSLYYQTIEAGKSALFKGDPESALAIFEKAKQLDLKPTLACFYHGQAFLLKQALDPARSSFNLGLTYNKIHYKCLVGLFDALQKEGMHNDAYDVVRKIVRYFPANPKRLAEVLRLAVMTNNFEDIERYYQAFTEIEARTEDLLRYICAALVTCGKFYLRNKSRNRALVLFEKASLYSSERPYILREIMVSLLTDGMHKEAASFLRLFSTNTHSSPEYMAMKYIIYDDRALVPESSIIEGERLLDRGIQYPEIYRTLISRCAQMKHPEKAKRLFEEACQMFPDTEPDFWNIPMFQPENNENEEESSGADKKNAA